MPDNGSVASRQLIVVINKFTEVLELQLHGIRTTLSSAVEEVMEGITAMSNMTGKEAEEANKILEKTYFDPDSETKELILSVQSSVDELMESIRERPDFKDMNFNKLEKETERQLLLASKLRRFVGQFSKHMEALSTMDNAIGSALFKMMASLSSDDVIGQRLEHLLYAVRAFEVGLSYILIDFQGRFSHVELDKLKKDLLSYTFRQYTMEEEKELFKKYFGDPPGGSGAKNQSKRNVS